MADKKTHDPQEPVTITLPWEDMATVLHWVQYGGDYHACKMHEWLANCVDKKMGGSIAREHELQAANAERLAKIIEAAMIPNPAKLY